jgi:hypothetical protein
MFLYSRLVEDKTCQIVLRTRLFKITRAAPSSTLSVVLKKNEKKQINILANDDRLID